MADRFGVTWIQRRRGDYCSLKTYVQRNDEKYWLKFPFLSQEIASLLKTPNPEILKNSLGLVTPKRYCFILVQLRSIDIMVFFFDEMFLNKGRRESWTPKLLKMCVFYLKNHRLLKKTEKITKVAS